ncbi:MAG: LysM peptidoglycan-binding domain-containing M23 family metallopeptidase [Pseudomonadota bacterium]
MSRVVELLRSRRVPQIAALALVSVGFAGCSADTSTRFSQNGFGWRGQEATGSVQPQYAQPQYAQPQYAPSGPVESRPLPQYNRPQYSAAPMPPIAAPQSYPTGGVSSGGGGHGMASYTPPAAYTPPPAKPIETTATVAPRSVAATPAAGTAIIVGTSDTVDVLARRYNVSPAAILQANRLSGPRALQPGQRLIIPHPTVAAAAPAAPPALAPAPATRAATLPATVHVVNRGDTLMSIARRNHVSLSQLAKANNLPANSQLKLGMKINVPARTAEAVPAAGQPAMPVVAEAKPVTAAPAPAAVPARVASVEPTQKALLANPTAPVAEAEPVKAADATSGLPSFRWPVRGRVITAYGAKNNGKQNDGINVAVPEGTPIKAAEDGVVAYSGSELKGYGNLVLVRHSNGYVTAYAHASELMVKRGETIKRGQTIAKSGQTGEVGSPQLHFEIRKGSSPVDPLQFLNGA